MESAVEPAAAFTTNDGALATEPAAAFKVIRQLATDVTTTPPAPAIVIVVVVSAIEPPLSLPLSCNWLPTRLLCRLSLSELIAVCKAMVQLATDATIMPTEVAIVLGEQSVVEPAVTLVA